MLIVKNVRNTGESGFNAALKDTRELINLTGKKQQVGLPLPQGYNKFRMKFAAVWVNALEVRNDE